MRVPVQKQVIWWGIAALLLMLVMWRLSSTITPFLVGAGIAYLLDPLAGRLERLGLSRLLAVVVITLLVLMALAAALLFAIPLVLRQGAQLLEQAPAFLEQAREILSGIIPEDLSDNGVLADAMDSMAGQLSQFGGRAAQMALQQASSLFSVIMFLVIAPVVAFYLLLDWNKMIARIDSLLPREHATTIRQIASDIDSSLGGFLRGEGVVILILATFYSAGLFLVGLPYSFAIGIAAASLSFIPYVGTVLGAVASIGVAVVTFWDEPMRIGAVAAVFIAGQLAESNYLQPRIVGHHVGLHPVWLMLALAVFGTLFGFAGLLIAVPLAAALGVVVRFLTERYKESPLYTGQEFPPPPQAPTLIEIVPPGTVARERSAAEHSARTQNQAIKMGEILEEQPKPVDPVPSDPAASA